MAILSDLQTLYHLTLAPVRGDSHADRLESFYSRQAADYDRFRDRLLQGREELWSALPCPAGGVWLDFGGGTGANLERLGLRIADLSQVYIVDLSRSLLEVARRRIADRGWQNVQAVEADATQFEPPRQADVITFSYSLTMIPDWFAAVDHSYQILRPGGLIGVVDFFVARKHGFRPHARHGWFTRTLWPAWFACDNVFLNADHLPYLQRRFTTQHFSAHRAKLPFVPGVRVPYYRFIGQKHEET